MQKRIVINKGKKYIVNCVGWENSIGPSAADSKVIPTEI